MAQESSFDIVSKVDLQEVDNAVNQAKKEIAQRFDFKGSKSRIDFNKNEAKVVLLADDEMKLKNLKDVLATKLAKRGISLKSVRYGKEEAAEDGCIRQNVEIVQGISSEKAKEIVKLIKSTKMKVQASIQGEQVRVSGKKRDDLQEVISLVKNNVKDTALQFVNYR